MNRPVGGRGRRVPYDTMVMRIPVPCWEAIDDFVMRYRHNIKNNGFANVESRKISEITEIINEYKRQAKTSRDWAKCNQLIAALEEKIAADD